MAGLSRPLLLCELHAHTTWSDGSLSIRELVDVYGAEKFDVVCVTDHTVRSGDPMPTAVDAGRWHAYVNEIDREAQRAQRSYGLLLIPGLELTDNRLEDDDSAHALAIGLRHFVSVEEGITAAILEARAAGAAIVAAHPYGPRDATPLRPTRRFVRELDSFRSLVHRWELFNRRETFSSVAVNALPAIATGDFHRREDLASWKTLLECERDEQAVLEFLRSNRSAYLTPFGAGRADPLAKAA